MIHLFKKNKNLALAILLLLTLSISSVFGFMLSRSDTIENNFEAASPSCQIVESFNGNQKTSVQIQNTSNIACYMRLRMVTHWVNDQNEIVGQPTEQLVVDFDNSQWIRTGNTFVYKNPVQPKDFSAELLKSPLVLEEKTVDEVHLRQVVEIFAECIQAEPKDAVKESWNVNIQ